MRKRVSSKKRIIKTQRGKAAIRKGHHSQKRLMPKRPSPYHPQAAVTAAVLKTMDVQRVAGFEELHSEQLARMARFQTNGIPPGRWLKLKRCDGGICPNRNCSAACAFGERFEVNETVLRATELLGNSGMPLHTVAIIDPHYFQPLGSLHEMSLEGLFLSLRRRIAEASDVFEGGLAVGSVHISLDRESDGSMQWTPHIHLVVAANERKHAVKLALRPKRKPNEKVLRPTVVSEVTHLANAISYATKINVDTRDAAEDWRGNRTRHRFPIAPSALAEHDLWLLRLRPRDRIFVSGMMHSRGGLTLRSRGR